MSTHGEGDVGTREVEQDKSKKFVSDVARIMGADSKTFSEKDLEVRLFRRG